MSHFIISVFLTMLCLSTFPTSATHDGASILIPRGRIDELYFERTSVQIIDRCKFHKTNTGLANSHMPDGFKYQTVSL